MDSKSIFIPLLKPVYSILLQKMEENLNNKLKDRLYKHLPSKKPGTQSIPTLISATSNHKSISNSVLVPKIKMEQTRKMPPIDRSMIAFKQVKSIADTNHQIRKKEVLKQIQVNELSSEAKAMVQLRKTLVGQGVIKDQKHVNPIAVFQFFKNLPYMCQDFFYLNKGSHPYDYHVVEFRQKNPNEYMTISCKGVTQFICKQTYFMSQQQWINEEKMYHNLQKIDFFKNYKINKNFRIWRNLMKRHHLQQISNVLNQKLFLTIHPSRKAILAIRNQCMIFEERCRMFMTDLRDTFEIQQFQQVIRDFQKGPFLQIIRRHEDSVVQILQASIQQWIQEYKKQNNIETKDGKNYNYSRKALLRMQFIKIAHLIKLVQAIVKDSKLNMAINNIEIILDHLRNIGDQQKEESIICRADWNNGNFLWIPSKNKFKNVFVDLVNHAIKMLSDDARNLEQLPIFSEYKAEEEHVESKKEERKTLFSICTQEQRYKVMMGEIISELEKTFNNFSNQEDKLIQFIEIYEKHANNNELKEEMYSTSAAELRRMIKQFKSQQTKMQGMEERTQRGLISLDYSKLRGKIVNVPTESLNTILTELPQLMLKKSNNLESKTSEYLNELSQYPNNVQKFVKCMECVNKTSNYLQQLNNQSQELTQIVFLMDQQKIPSMDRYRTKAKETSLGVQKLKSKIDEFYASYDQNLNKFKKQLQGSVVKVNSLVDELISKFANVPLNKKDSSIDQIIEFIEENRKLAEQVNQQATQTNNLQSSLGLPVTGFAKVQAFYVQFDLMSRLWLGRKKWYETITKVKQQHFEAVDIEALDSCFNQTIELTCELIQSLAQESEVAKVFKQQVMNFSSVIKTLKALRDPNLRQDQEWIQIPEFIFRKSHPEIKDELNVSQLPLFNRKETIYTVSWLVQHGIHQWHSDLSYFGIKAAKEKELSEILNECRKFIAESQIVFIPFKQSKDVYRLSDQNKRLFQDIDQKLVILYNVMANKYSKNLHQKVEILIKQYQYLQELFEQMILHQQNWSLLEPILSNTSSKILIKELKDFSTCDTQWKRVTKNLRQNASCFKIANDYVNKQHLKTITKSNDILQQIQKSLDDFLDKKRSALPRLYFISNQELISLMSEAHSLKEVSPFLYKLFTAVKELQFDKDMPTGIISFDQEVIGFKQFGIRPQGEIQELMKMIEQQIKKSLSSMFKTLLPKYDDQEISLQTLVTEYPSQIANIIEWITWTKIGENYLGPDPIGELYNWLEIQEEQIRDLVVLLKKKEVSHRHKAIRSLFVQSLYLKENTYSMMMKGVSSTNDYNWLKILKFHSNHSNPEISMSQFASKLSYGFEFQVIGSPLVITQTCQRQILNLSQVLSQNNLPTLVGKSCTGKTQTLKGMSHILGHNLIMCTCDNDSSIKVIERLVMASCSTGSWILFEEFDSLSLSTMSALASMMSTIFKGLAASKENIMLTKSNIALSPTTSLFLSTLDNKPFRTQIFKEYQRIVSFKPIEKQELYRIMLDSYCFVESSKLSYFVVQAIELVNSQTVESAYHLNLRDSKQIILQLCQLDKTSFESQEKMLVHTLEKMIVPRINDDSGKFRTFLNEIYTQADKQESHSKLETFNQLLDIKSSVVVYGESLSGKTTFIKQANQKTSAELEFVTINSLKTWQIIGSHDNRINGLLANIPRDSWLVFDGPLDKIQTLYSQMQSDYVSLEKGETIIDKNLKVIFQTENLSEISPTLLGKIGLLHMDKTLNLQKIIERQLSTISNPLVNPNILKLLQTQLNCSFRKIMSLKNNYSLLVPNNQNSLLISCCQNLVNFCESLSYVIKEKDSKQLKKVIQKIVGWCIAWGIGKIVTQDSVQKFDKVLGQIIKAQNQPPSLIFNYCLSSSTCEWTGWDSLNPVNPYSISSNNNIYISNSQSSCFNYFISNCIRNNKSFVVIGQTGIGRSAVVKNCLQELKNEHNLYYLPIIMPQPQDSRRLQELIQNDMQHQKRFEKNYLVPIAGKKLIVQIQELNMGSSNSSIQLLRSLISHSGVYDRKTFLWKQVENLTIASMGRLKGGEEPYMRFTNLLQVYIKRNNRQSMLTIFGKMIDLWYNGLQVEDGVRQILKPNILAKATLDIMQGAKLMQKNSNCVWQTSYKDINFLLSMMMQIKLYNLHKPDGIIRLWSYELMRSFGDRLQSKAQKQKLAEDIKRKALVEFRFVLNQNLVEPENLYTSRIVSIDYQQSTLETIENQIEKKLESNQKASILMFRDIIDHITRISRGVNMQNGHFMMIGNRGVGKTSIAKFTCYLLGMNIESGQCLKSQENFMNCLIKAASEEQTCIILNETDLEDPNVLFIVKSIICNSMQSITFSREHLELITGQHNPEMNWKVQALIKTFFEKAYSFIHLIFCLVPTTQVRQLLQRQPLLSRNCTVDYVNQWPEATFVQLTQMNLFQSFSVEEKQQLSRLNFQFYQSTVEMTKGSKKVVSPKQYLQTISLFNTKYAILRQQIEFSDTKILRSLKYVSDINQIIIMEESNQLFLEQEMEKLNVQKNDLKERLLIKEAELTKLQNSNFDSDDSQYALIKKQFSNINEKKSKLVSNFKKSNQLLNSISSKDILLLKTTGQNPQTKGILQLAAILLKQSQTWECLNLSFLNNTSLLSRLKVYEITESNIQSLTALADHMNSIESITDTLTNTTLNILVKWFVNFMDIVNQHLNLCGQQKDLYKENSIFIEYATIEQQLLNIQTSCDNYNYYKDLLDYDIKKSEKKIKTCRNILQTIQPEIEQWNHLKIQNQTKLKMLTTNLFLACCTFKYLSMFKNEERNILTTKWKDILKAENLQHNQNFIETLFDPYEVQLVRNYTKQNFLNCIVMLKSPGVPYLLDPNRLFYTFLKQNYQNLKILNYNQQNYLKSLQSAVKNGYPVLLQYKQKYLDPILSELVRKVTEDYRTITIVDTEIQYSPQFKLFILDPRVDPDISQQIYINCPVIRFDMMKGHIYEQLQVQFQDTIFVEEKYKHSQAINDLIANKVRMQKKQDLLMSMIQSLNIDAHNILEILQDYSNVQSQKKFAMDQIQNLQKSIMQISSVLDQHNGLITIGTNLAEIVLEEHKSIFTFKKFREVFVKNLVDFDKNSFADKFIGQIYMRILYSLPKEREQQVALLFNIYHHCTNIQEFRSIWNTVNTDGQSSPEDLLIRCINQGLIPQSVKQKVMEIKSSDDPLLDDLNLTKIQKNIVSFLANFSLNFPPKLSQYQYAKRALADPHPILIVNSQDVQKFVMKLAQQYEVPQSQVLFIYAGQLLNNQEEFSKFSWFLIQNCDGHSKILEMVDKFKRPQTRFFLTYKDEKMVPNNIYPITRIHLCLRKNLSLIDEDMKNSLIEKYSSNNDSATRVLSIIDIFNKKSYDNQECACYRMCYKDIQGIIKGAIDIWETFHLSTFEIRESIMTLWPCTLQSHLDQISGELQSVFEQSAIQLSILSQPSATKKSQL